MSIFEVGMLVCFGIGWPVSIYKVWRTKKASGKSLLFLGIVALGYLSGIAHKLVYAFDHIIWLYALNLVMVLTDLALCIRYRDPRASAQDVLGE